MLFLQVNWTLLSGSLLLARHKYSIMGTPVGLLTHSCCWAHSPPGVIDNVQGTPTATPARATS